MEMTFGKYKDRTVEEVFETNPGYFIWMKDKGMTNKEEYQYFIEVIPTDYPESFQWEVDIRSGYQCWSCKKPMNIMLVFNPETENELREGYPIVSDLAYNKPPSMIFFAKQNGIKLQERFSKTINEKTIMHICPHCNMHQGDYHVVEDNHQETELVSTLKIKFDRNKKTWLNLNM